MSSQSRSAESRRPLLTVEQFAAALALKPKTVRNKIYLGDIPCLRLFGGRVLRLRPETLDAMIAAGEQKSRAIRRARRQPAPQVAELAAAPSRRYSGGAR